MFIIEAVPKVSINGQMSINENKGKNVILFLIEIFLKFHRDTPKDVYLVLLRIFFSFSLRFILGTHSSYHKKVS